MVVMSRLNNWIQSSEDIQDGHSMSFLQINVHTQIILVACNKRCIHFNSCTTQSITRYHHVKTFYCHAWNVSCSSYPFRFTQSTLYYWAPLLWLSIKYNPTLIFLLSIKHKFLHTYTQPEIKGLNKKYNS